MTTYRCFFLAKLCGTLNLPSPALPSSPARTSGQEGREQRRYGGGGTPSSRVTDTALEPFSFPVVSTTYTL